jgi:outer membrane protein TolC
MRWKRLLVAMALLLAVVNGCKQQCFLTEADYNRTQTTLLEGLELKPDLHAQPLTNMVNAPPTLENLDRKVRFISLAECIALALEQGRVGQPSLLFPGTALDNLVSFNGPGGPSATLGAGVGGSDAIRVLALDPAFRGTQIELALSKFDAVFFTSLTWGTNNTEAGPGITTINGVQGNPTAESDAVFLQSGFFKQLPTGGVTAITVNGAPVAAGSNIPGAIYSYQGPNPMSNNPVNSPVLNPVYKPAITFQFEQPLLQGFGVEINQLRASHPGSILNPGVIPNNPPTQEGILITRLRFDQQRAEFERNVIQMLLNAEVAYWNLYGAYWQLYSREQGLRFAYEAYKLSKYRYEAGQVKAADFYQTKGQYELFRAQRVQAISTVLENERQLRNLLSMDIEDGTRLMPSDSPTLAPYHPDWKTSLEDTLSKRPELYMARQEVKVAQMNLMLAKNALLPDLRFTSTYDYNAAGGRLDGRTTGAVPNANALRNLASGQFSDWTIGLRLIIPIGYRFAFGQVRQAQLELARTMEILKDQELKAQSFLGRYYEQISVSYEQIRANRAQREAFGEQLRARQEEYKAGRGTLDILLEAQRFWADALASEYAAIVTYNNNLVEFEYAKGTIMQHDNVTISEGALPACAQVRAVEHERERTDALVLRERALPSTPACGQGANGQALSLPAALAATPPLKEVPPLPATTEPGKPTELPPPVEMKPEELFPPRPVPPTPKTPPAAMVLPPVPSTRNNGWRTSDFGTTP